MLKDLLRDRSSSFFLKRLCFPFSPDTLVQKHLLHTRSLKDSQESSKSSPIHLQLYCMYTNIYKDIINSTLCCKKNIGAYICAQQTMTAKGNKKKINFPISEQNSV